MDVSPTSVILGSIGNIMVLRYQKCAEYYNGTRAFIHRYHAYNDALIYYSECVNIYRVSQTVLPLPTHITFKGEKINNSSGSCLYNQKGGGFLCVRKCPTIPKNRGLGGNSKMLNTNTFQSFLSFARYAPSVLIKMKNSAN